MVTLQEKTDKAAATLTVSGIHVISAKATGPGGLALLKRLVAKAAALN